MAVARVVIDSIESMTLKHTKVSKESVRPSYQQCARP
eukprot:COSAG05_NODE_20877_length_276_cov_0.587571_2_plen_36_part_01